MPPVLPYPLGKITRSVPPQTWPSRRYVWGTVIFGSRLPEIICRQLGFDMAVSVLPLSQTLILLGLAIVAAKLHPTKSLAGFILTVAALKFGWDVVVPRIEASIVFQSALHNLSWGGRFFLLRAVRTIGVGFLILSLIGSGIGRRELFLRLGNWRAPVNPGLFLR